ncbi:MAG: endonuclease [Bacteroidota bacterium]|nr:endonuclease [Bacteroidota bacterium]
MKKIILSTLFVFSAVVVYSQAILPTSWSFPTVNLPAGWTESGTNFYTASGNTPPAMKFDNTDDYLLININSNPGDLTYYLTGNGFSGGTFTVEESDLGSIWTALNTHTSPPNASYIMFTDVPQATTRFIRFKYTNKVSGNIGLDDVSIALGAATPAQEINVKEGGISIVSGNTYIANSPVSVINPITFMIENLGTLDTLNITSATVSGINSMDFSVISFPSQVAASDSGNLILNFTPSVAGTRIATLTINSNDVDEPSYIINLYGIGGDLASEPIEQATNLVFSDIKTYRINISFTPADSVDGYLVLRKEGSAITAEPLDGIVYQRGDIIGDAQVVSSDNTTSLFPNNIVAGKNYYFKVFSYNGPNSFRNYFTNAPLAGNVQTPLSMMPATYYSSLNSASTSFMNDLHALINPHQMQYYSYYDDLMIPFFEARDTTLDRRVVTCVYSGENLIYTEPFDFTANGYSREHTYCHSWMPTYPAQSLPEYSDFHHLFPSNLNSANILRSNNPLGEVVNVTTSFLGCKSGINSIGQTVFEPRDDHKGDAARAIMYQAICYNSISGNNWALPSNQDQMILKNWHFQDPPDGWEIARNDFIDSLQNNRNPFIDSIDYVCFVNFSNMSYDPSACVVSSIEELLNKGFVTYPNPCEEELNLHVDATTISSYQITDCLGRVVLSDNINNRRLVKVDMSKITTGAYLVKVVTPFGEAQKIIMVE